MVELTTSESNEDLGFQKPPKQPEKKLTRLKVNLSTPLLVNTESGENKAGPGDVVGRFGKKDVMMSKDLFIALLGRAKYDELVKKEMLKIRIAKRLDDQQPPFNEEEIAKQKEEIEKIMSAKQEAEGPEFDPTDVRQLIQVIDSSEGPPTIKPDLYATIIPGPMIPIPPDIEEESEIDSETFETQGDRVDPTSGESAEQGELREGDGQPTGPTTGTPTDPRDQLQNPFTK